eukprot:jgi/Ulvmu1/12906/UM098_0094.1
MSAKRASSELLRLFRVCSVENVTHGLSARQINTRAQALDPERIQWVFLGPPGVGKGTYSTRVAVSLGVAHIAAGDLVRGEIKQRTPLGQKMQTLVNRGDLLPDHMISQLLNQRIERGKANGETGFVLDGFPRTVAQAKELMSSEDVQLAVNLQLREEVLVEKCMGRRICKKCGKGWNVADIYLPASGNRPDIIMPPLDPPAECMAFMEQREDDKEDVIRRRLEVYRKEASPVEDFFQEKGVLLDFEITAGIPETLPHLLGSLKPHVGNWEMAEVDL